MEVRKRGALVFSGNRNSETSRTTGSRRGAGEIRGLPGPRRCFVVARAWAVQVGAPSESWVKTFCWVPLSEFRSWNRGPKYLAYFLPILCTNNRHRNTVQSNSKQLARLWQKGG